LNTERLRLVDVREEHVEAIVGLWTDPRVTEAIGGPRNPDLVRTYFHRMALDPKTILAEDGDRWWSVCLLESYEWIGMCGLLTKEIDESREIELTYFFLPSAWGCGYATEAAQRVTMHAFANLGIPSVIALIDPTNKRSANVAARIGMILEREITRPGGAVRRLYRLSSPRS
jgi:[ribosomal protein S5]-alanine N-acetyltransferase